MALAVTTYVTPQASTSNVQSYASSSFTPAQGDLIVCVAAATAEAAAGTCVASANGITFTRLTDATPYSSSAHRLYVWVADQLVGSSPGSMTVTPTFTGDNASGCTWAVFKVTGMLQAGTSAVRQFKVQANQTSGTPSITFDSAVLTGNAMIGAVGAEGVSSSVAVEPSSTSERCDTGHSSPTAGAEMWSRDSGFTGTTVTWTSISGSATAWASIVLEVTAAGPPVTATGSLVSGTGTVLTPASIVAQSDATATGSLVSGTGTVFTPASITAGTAWTVTNASNISGGTTTVAVTMPSCSAGDYIYVRSGHTGNGAISMDGTGYTTITAWNRESLTYSSKGWEKISEGNEGGTTLTVTSATGRNTIIVAVVHHAGGQPDGIDDTDNQSYTSGFTSSVHPAVDTTMSGDLLLMFDVAQALATAKPTWTEPSGWQGKVYVVNSQVSGNVSVEAFAYLVVGAPGSYGTYTATWSSTADYGEAGIVALRPYNSGSVTITGTSVVSGTGTVLASTAKVDAAPTTSLVAGVGTVYAPASVTAYIGGPTTMTASGTLHVRNYRWALDKVATSEFTVVGIGDSVTEGTGASALANRWLDVLRARLRTDYPVSGVSTSTVGYVPAFYTMDAWEPWSSPTLAGATAVTEEAIGLGARAVRLVNTNDTITFTGTGSVIEVHYYKTNFFTSGITITIDGDQKTQINAYRAEGPLPATWTSDTLTDTSHTVVVSYWAANGEGLVTRVLGARFYQADAGKAEHVLDASHGGWTADLMRIQDWAQFAMVSPDLAVVALGFNDAGGTYSPASFTSNLLLLFAALRAADPAVPIMVVGLYNPRDAEEDWEYPDWSLYIDAMQDAVDSSQGGQVEFLDLSTVMPDTWAMPSLYADLVHPADAGHARIAAYVGDLIEKWVHGAVTMGGEGTMSASATTEIVATAPLVSGTGAVLASTARVDAAPSTTTVGGTGTVLASLAAVSYTVSVSTVTGVGAVGGAGGAWVVTGRDVKYAGSAETHTTNAFTATANSLAFWSIQVQQWNHTTNPTWPATITDSQGLTWDRIAYSPAVGSDANWRGAGGLYAHQYGATPASTTLTIDPDPGGFHLYAYSGLVWDVTGHNTSSPYRQSVAVNSGSTSGDSVSLTVTASAAATSGDLVMAVFGSQNDTAAVYAAMSGWTQVYNQSAVYDHQGLWYRSDYTSDSVTNTDLGTAIWWEFGWYIDLVPVAAAHTASASVVASGGVVDGTGTVFTPASIIAAGEVIATAPLVSATGTVLTPASIEAGGQVIAEAPLVAGVGSVPASSATADATVTLQGSVAVVRGISDHPVWLRDAGQEISFAHLATVGVQAVRFDVPWGIIEPDEKGTYNDYYLERIDHFIDGAHTLGLDILLTVTGCPQWANGTDPYVSITPPTSDTDFTDFLAYLVNRYAGKVSAYEVWNEPNGGWAWTNPDAERYTDMLIASYNRIKGIDESILVLNGGMSGTDGGPRAFLTAMYQNGAKDYFDVYSQHGYGDVDRGAYEGPYPLDPAFILGEFEEQMLPIMETYGDDTKRVWWTETGMSTAVGTGNTEAMQAQHLLGTFAAAETVPNLDRLYWYAWLNSGYDEDNVEANYGIINEGPVTGQSPWYPEEPWTLKAAFTALQSLAGVLAVGEVLGGSATADVVVPASTVAGVGAVLGGGALGDVTVSATTVAATGTVLAATASVHETLTADLVSATGTVLTSTAAADVTVGTTTVTAAGTVYTPASITAEQGGQDAYPPASTVEAAGTVLASSATADVAVTATTVAATGTVLTSPASAQVAVGASTVAGAGTVLAATGTAHVVVSADTVAGTGTVLGGPSTVGYTAPADTVPGTGTVLASTASVGETVPTTTVAGSGTVLDPAGLVVWTVVPASPVDVAGTTFTPDTIEAGGQGDALATAPLVAATGTVLTSAASVDATVSASTITAPGVVLGGPSAVSETVPAATITGTGTVLASAASVSEVVAAATVEGIGAVLAPAGYQVDTVVPAATVETAGAVLTPASIEAGGQGSALAEAPLLTYAATVFAATASVAEVPSAAVVEATGAVLEVAVGAGTVPTAPLTSGVGTVLAASASATVIVGAPLQSETGTVEGATASAATTATGTLVGATGSVPASGASAGTLVAPIALFTFHGVVYGGEPLTIPRPVGRVTYADRGIMGATTLGGGAGKTTAVGGPTGKVTTT